MNDLITTAEELRAAMRLLAGRGVTQEQLAEELGRSVVAVWNWKKGNAPVPRYAALHLRATHGITKSSLALASAA